MKEDGLFRFVLMAMFVYFLAFLGYENSFDFLSSSLQILVGAVTGIVSTLLVTTKDEVMGIRTLLRIIGMVLLIGMIVMPLSVEPQVLDMTFGPILMLVFWLSAGLYLAIEGMLPGAIAAFLVCILFTLTRSRNLGWKMLMGAIIGGVIAVNLAIAVHELSAVCCQP